MSEEKRTCLSQILLALYVITVLALPLVVLFVALLQSEEFFKVPGPLPKIIMILYFFVNVPTFSIYAFMMKTRMFPRSVKKAFFLFAPMVLSYSSYLLERGFTGIPDLLVMSSLPLYLGINMLFLGGVFYLVVKESMGETAKVIAGRISLALVLMVIFFTPPAFFLIFGITAATNGKSGLGAIMGLAVFFINIGLMVISHYGTLKNMYQSGVM